MIADDEKNANQVLPLFLTSSSQVCAAKLCPGSLPGGRGQLGRDATSGQEKRMCCGRPLGPPAWPYATEHQQQMGSRPGQGSCSQKGARLMKQRSQGAPHKARH